MHLSKNQLITFALNQGVQNLLHRTPWLNYRFSKPTFVIFQLNDACNLRCQQCNFWKFREMGMPTEKVVEGLKKLKEWLGPVHLTLTGGETLLRPDIADLVREASSLGLMVHLLTNGTLLTERTAAGLHDAHLSLCTVSLDGATAPTHDRLRGREGTYGKVIENIRRAKQHLRIQLAAILFKDNLGEVAGIVHLAEQEGLAGVLFQPVLMDFTGKAAPGDTIPYHLLPDSPAAVSKALENLISMKKKGSPINNSIGHLRLMESYLKNPFAPLGAFPSNEGLSSILILPNGDIDFSFGRKKSPLNIYTSVNLRKAWISPEIMHLRKKANREGGADALCNCSYRRPLTEKFADFMNSLW